MEGEVFRGTQYREVLRMCWWYLIAIVVVGDVWWVQWRIVWLVQRVVRVFQVRLWFDRFLLLLHCSYDDSPTRWFRFRRLLRRLFLYDDHNLVYYSYYSYYYR